MMQLDIDGVFIRSGIFNLENPAACATAIIRATTHYKDPKVLMEVEIGLGHTMFGIFDINCDPVNFCDCDGKEYKDLWLFIGKNLNAL
eukprot:1527450-Ditylum_brightwellii.AAC.1